MRKNTISADSYKIYIGDNSLKKLNVFLRSSKYKTTKLFVIVDSNTLQNCYPELLQNVKILEKAELIEIEPGEASKDLTICGHIWQTLSESEADRNSLLINLGGGVVSDIGGFVASVFKRGVNYINIPTSLLAMADASVGNKTGIDFNGLKNELGSFHPPLGVFIYPSFLRSLSQRDLVCGLAEMLKHGLIADANHWKATVKVDTDRVGISKLLFDTISIKNNIVLVDPKEKGKRKLLNFGHTIGHAVESVALANNIDILHGEAVIVGMIAEAHLSYQKNKLKGKFFDEIVRELSKLYLPKFKVSEHFGALMELMIKDKKSIEGKMNFTLLNSIGKAKINEACTEKQIKEALLFLDLIH